MSLLLKRFAESHLDSAEFKISSVLDRALGGFFSTIMGIVAFVVMARLLHRNRVQRDEDSPAAAAPTPPRFILYLRPFMLDSAMDRPGMVGAIKTEEIILRDALRPIGPMVAIGEPRCERVRLGATRLQVEESAWQKNVLNLLEDQPQLVVAALGPGDGIRWEMAQVVRRTSPDRVVLLLPRGRANYRRVQEEFSPILPAGIPDRPRDIRMWLNPKLWNFGPMIETMIKFDADWNPTAIYLPRGVASCALNLRSVFVAACAKQPGIKFLGTRMSKQAFYGTLVLALIFTALLTPGIFR